MTRRCAPALLVLFWCAAVRAGGDDRVRDAAQRLYIHGMTAEIAASEVGRDGVPTLLRLLDEPSFPRRDNVVAFLAYLGGPESTPVLLERLNRPLPAVASPEEVRALLLVPHALGRIAARGEGGATGALLAMTAHHANGGPIGIAARKGSFPVALRDDLVDAAVFGLALAGGSTARGRLEAIADGRIVPDAARPDLAARARAALGLFVEIHGSGSTGGGSAPTSPSVSGATARMDTSADAPVAPAVVYTPDPAPRSAGHGLTFANHANVTNAMTTARIDSLLQESSLRAATANFDGDVPCCVVVARSGTARTFGTTTDGLDTINDSTELGSVLGSSVARVKVVNAINYCGSAGTNIIGCGYQGGNGVALVRLSGLGFEAVLWIHEYGHNVGLGHATDARDLMYPSDSGANNGLAPAECSSFHSSSGGANALLSDVGACTDDGDPLADPIDNCPLVSNEDQADGDGNGIGDVCDSCVGGASDPDSDGVCGSADNCPIFPNANQADVDADEVGDVCDNCRNAPNTNQADADTDGVGDVCDTCPTDAGNDLDGDGACAAVDNCPAVANANQANLDGDPYGDACETGALRADADLSGRVDGFDLARLGRAFGAVTGGPRYDPTVDFDRDGQVDGADLALFAPFFGDRSF
jgi:hypothetical protein